jgi:elongation factor G
MKVEVSTPDEYQGELIGDLNRRRGQIQGMESRGTVCIIDSFVPLENMFGYSTDMRSLSSGRADYSMTPSHFDQVPQSLIQNIVETSSREPARS